jgi:hypothetical protein
MMWVDNMWTIEELQNLGVSVNDASFKIVLTTRDKEVCARMNVQETRDKEACNVSWLEIARGGI